MAKAKTTKATNVTTKPAHEGLTVGQLITLLKAHDPDMRVFEERQGEMRALNRTDVAVASGFMTADTGEEVEDEVILFSAWS